MARDKLKAIRTKKEFIDYLDSLAITDEEKQVAIELFLKGYTHAQISLKHNISIEKSKKLIQKVLDRVL